MSPRLLAGLMSAALASVTVFAASPKPGDSPSSSGSPVSEPAAKPGDFALADPVGKVWKPGDSQAKVIVVAFLARECPMANGYLPTLSAVAKKYADQSVEIVGVYADSDDTPAKVAGHAKEYQAGFPLFADPKQASVRALRATTTPEVVVLDEKRSIRYRGRIDDGYSARMKRKPEVSRHDLTVAIDELLAGKPVSVPETKPLGCPILLVETPTTPTATVTFHRDIEPILQQHCQACHRPGQVAPFSLLSYSATKKWAETSLEEMQSKRMPPWKASANPLLAGERSMPAAAIRTFQKWIEAGMPEGDAKDAPPAKTFTDGWALGKPDLILEADESVTIDASGRDHFRVQVFPTNLPEDKYIVAMEVKPGNPRVVHHTLQLIDTSGQARKLAESAKKKAKPTEADHGPGYPVSMGWGFFPDRTGMAGGWVPGMMPKKLPDGIGQKLPRGADLCVQFHYHRTGKVETDRTRVGLYFADKPVTRSYRTIPVAGLFRAIPAGDAKFVVENEWTVTEDLTVFRLSPHMHLLGKDIELTATKPGDKEVSLIRVPAWDYNWQEQYELKEPIKLPKGTVLRIRATFDNSKENPLNPSSPPQNVRLGEQTTNEMCFVFLGISTQSKAARLLSPKGSLFGR